jgi:hypothetical protein
LYQKSIASIRFFPKIKFKILLPVEFFEFYFRIEWYVSGTHFVSETRWCSFLFYYYGKREKNHPDNYRERKPPGMYSRNPAPSRDISNRNSFGLVIFLAKLRFLNFHARQCCNPASQFLMHFNRCTSNCGKFSSALSKLCEPAWNLKPFSMIFHVASFQINFSCKIYAKVITQPLYFQGALCHTRIFPAYPHFFPVFQFLLAMP